MASELLEGVGFHWQTTSRCLAALLKSDPERIRE